MFLHECLQNDSSDSSVQKILHKYDISSGLNFKTFIDN